MPKLTPHPWDPVRVLSTDAVALLLLPPALSLVHPAVYLPASIFVLLTPARNSASLLAAPPLPLLPTAITTLMTSAALKPQGNHHQRTTSHGPPSPCLRRPCHPGRGGGGKGAEHSTLLLPGLHSQSVRTSARSFPCRRCHRRQGLSWGGAPAAAVAGRGGSSGSDNDMACGRILCFWFGGDVNYLVVNDVVWAGPVGMVK
jgi:hypothetical protein